MKIEHYRLSRELQVAVEMIRLYGATQTIDLNKSKPVNTNEVIKIIEESFLDSGVLAWIDLALENSLDIFVCVYSKYHNHEIVIAPDINMEFDDSALKILGQKHYLELDKIETQGRRTLNQIDVYLKSHGDSHADDEFRLW